MSVKFDMLVKTFHGFEDIVADEIRSFGGENIENLKKFRDLKSQIVRK